MKRNSSTTPYCVQYYVTTRRHTQKNREKKKRTLKECHLYREDRNLNDDEKISRGD